MARGRPGKGLGTLGPRRGSPAPDGIDAEHRARGGQIEYKDGAVTRTMKGKLHCEIGPAVENRDGGKEWFVDGLRHRIGGPAIAKPDGSQEWLVDGLQHRLDGPALTNHLGGRLWAIEGQTYSSEAAWQTAKEQQAQGREPNPDPLKFFEQTVRSVDYSDIDKLIDQAYPFACFGEPSTYDGRIMREGYSCVSENGWSNDASYNLTISNKLDQWEEEELQAWLIQQPTTHYIFPPPLSTLLADICRRGLLEPGEYLICVCW